MIINQEITSKNNLKTHFILACKYGKKLLAENNDLLL